MRHRSSAQPLPHTLEIEAIAQLIADAQTPTGEIPWFTGDKTDPWDHVEAAIGLSIGGRLREACQAFQWLSKIQNPDGSWYAAYRDGHPLDLTRDANVTAYVAVGVYHNFLITHDVDFLRQMWPCVKHAVDFTLNLQAPGGQIHWAISPEGNIDRMALLTGSCSIFMSLKCALAIARHLNIPQRRWQEGLILLGRAISDKPYLFNMTKSRYAMDWFYPVLAGAITGQEARRRIDNSWKKFVIEAHGVLCVSDEPWITIAETSELALSLASMGNTDQAKIVFNWIADKIFEDGTFWCGYTYPDMIIWPEDRITWTNAVVLMAADAIYELTPASVLFSHNYWESMSFIPLLDPQR